MVIDIFAEGSYPFVVGGVSGWVQMLILNSPEYEFVLQTLLPDRTDSGKFKYEIPSNVRELWECYLNDLDYTKKSWKKKKYGREIRSALRSLVFGENVQWKRLFQFFDEEKPSVNELLMGSDFFHIIEEFYLERYPQCVFTDFLWNMRSLYLPLFTVLKQPVAEADCYHSVSAGYAGILACKGKLLYGKPMILTEHGIYSREREEEIIRVDWTKGLYKDIWINYFYMLSKCAYDMADVVISLFSSARLKQIELGCAPEKAIVIPNGVPVDDFTNLPQKEENDKYINIGGVLRIVPIKDVKTMINAFSIAKRQNQYLRLYLMGPTEENPEYYEECLDMIHQFGISDIIFTGRINVKEYLGKMDFTILTSISEGQPLTMLESMSAYKPCIATDVGGCKELIYGDENDSYGPAGILVPVMNVEKIARAILKLAENPDLCRDMGMNGRKRVENLYQKKDLISTYQKLYSKLNESRD